MLNIDQVKAMSREDALAWADKYAGLQPGTMDGLWRTETNRGAHPTLVGPSTKWGTAKGHFQALDSTHAAIEQRVGKPLNRFDFYESLVGAAELMKENRTREGNDDDAIMAYHGGPNRKQWGEKTADYLMKVTGRAGQPVTKRTAKSVSPETGAVETTSRPAAELWTTSAKDVAAMERPDPKLEAFTRTLQVAPVGAADAPAGAVEASRAAGEAQTKEIRDTRFWGLYDRDTVLGAAYNRTMGANFRMADMLLGNAPDSTPDRDWVSEFSTNAPKYLQGYTAEEQDLLVSNLSNRETYEATVGRIAEQRQDNLVMRKGGNMQTGAAMLVSGALDPMTWATGVGATKAFAVAGIGSVALAEQSRRAAAVGSLFAENAVGNMSYELFQQAMGEHKSVGDYALAGALGVLPASLGYRSVDRAVAQSYTSRILKEEVERQTKTMQQASANLGPNATMDELVAEASRLEAKELKTEAAARVVPAAETERINAPDIDDMKLEPEPKPVEPLVQRETGAPLTDEALTVRINRPNYAARVAESGVKDAIPDITARPAGVSLDASAAGNDGLTKAATVLEQLRAQFLPDHHFVLAQVPEGATSQGKYGMVGEKHSFIVAKDGDVKTLAHEFGHAVLFTTLRDATPEVRGQLREAWKKWQATPTFRESIMRRVGVTRSIDPAWSALLGPDGAKVFNNQTLEYKRYFKNFDEYGAEQFVKLMEEQAEKASRGVATEVAVPRPYLQMLAKFIGQALELFKKVKEMGWLAPDATFKQYFLDVAKRTAETPLDDVPAVPATKAPVDPLDIQQGLDLMKDTTPRERMEKKAIREMYRAAIAFNKANPVNEEALKTAADNKFFNFATPATLLMKSQNPLARQIASVLMEHTMGAGGRRNTAAIASVQINREFVGNTIIRFDNAYVAWRNSRVGAIKGAMNDMFARSMRDEFDMEVRTYREALLAGKTPEVDPMVKAASDALTDSYARMAASQKAAKVPGWAALPDDSKGYTPRVLSADKVIAATDAQLRVYQRMLYDQLIAREEFDPAFAERLSKQYLDHARINAHGGHEIPANVYDPNAADYVRQALKSMGMSEDEVLEYSNRLAAGAARHTKSRLDLDLNAVHTLEDGSEFRLIDLYQNDQIGLLRTYARRASGDVALTGVGIAGSAGLALVRRALQFGEHRLTGEQMKAFDQVGAEILGRPFGDGSPQWLDNALSLTASANLGGMGIMQVAETINIAMGIGIKHTMEAISAGPRLMGEVHALARGETVKNSILGSMELPGGGGEFGLDGYKMVTAYDSPSTVIDTYNRDSVGVGTRLIRAAGHSMRALTGQRLVHAVQTRGVAEQITLKALQAHRTGVVDKTLEGMGFTPDVLAGIDSKAVVWNGDRVKEFDITKLSPEVGQRFAAAVRRGTAQLVQEALPGERMSLQHSSWGKVLTQFRTFPLLAVEKQWGRNRVMHGPAVAAAMVVAGAGAALPIYLARVALNAQGRPDRDEYVAKMTTPQAMARATMNYVGAAGLMGEVMDGFSAVGNDLGLFESENAMTGKRHSIDSIIPLAGYASQVLSLPSNLDDPHKAVRVLPWSNTPLAIPVVNGFRPE